ncbi:asparaginase [Metabacillus iocasae]|uniref:asparaginase n=1 Tax=Priestia iocasae TaxID=2291674 RepID=A0ABS2QQG5_9BACI|nr:asparaginase [Metabacillus iocasae]MBM7701699.1 L-asparaginase [Metabacillus iocasae]
MKTVYIIHTGGTISMKEDKQTGAVAPDSQNPLVYTTPSITALANVIVEEAFHLPSPHITPNEMLLLSKKIEEKAKQQIDAVVITHGTDTLEETAYFLDLTVHADIPIVLTGAMRSSNEIGSDGPHNFISSLRVAISDEAKGKGVLVVMNDEIHTAKNVTKTHTSNVATFQSPQYGPIGIVTKQHVLFHHMPTARDLYTVHKVNKQVLLLKAYAGMDEQIFNAICDMNVDGLVIEALGQGNLPPRTLEGIRGLLDKHIPIVLVSRCFNGIAQDVYGYEGGGKQLKDLGLIFSNGLSGQKARIKLLTALEQTSDRSTLQTMFLK